MTDDSTHSGVADGRGGKDSTSTAKADPRYVYYRLYTKEGALESHNPIYSDDHFISHFLSNSVTPPRTAASLKTHLCWIEGFEASKTCDLYLSLSDKESVEDSTRMQLRGKDTGPGWSPFLPIALVVDLSAAEKRTGAAGTKDLKELPKWEGKQRHLYYRVYNQKGEIASKTSFDETKVALGRINSLFIAPPHTGASLKSCLLKLEAVIDRDAQLYEDDDGDTPLNDSDFIDLCSDSCPGINEDAPMALVHGPQEKNSTVQPQDPVSSFSKQLKATYTFDAAESDAAWHTLTVREIFKTDGVLRKKNFAGTEYDCYEAINSSGKRALVHQVHSEFC